LWGFVKVSEDYKKKEVATRNQFIRIIIIPTYLFFLLWELFIIIPEPIVFIYMKDMLIPYFNKPSLQQT